MKTSSPGEISDGGSPSFSGSSDILYGRVLGAPRVCGFPLGLSGKLNINLLKIGVHIYNSLIQGRSC